jgi:hypothetical protein
MARDASAASRNGTGIISRYAVARRDFAPRRCRFRESLDTDSRVLRGREALDVPINAFGA